MNKKLLKELDALLITDPINIRYLTTFRGVSPEEREAYVLVCHNALFLFTHSLYIEAARKLRMKNYELRIIEISREQPLVEKLKEVLDKQGSDLNKKGLTLKLGFEEDNLTVKELRTIEEKLYSSRLRSNSNYTTIKLVPTSGRVENLRQIKRPDEIKFIRQAARLTDHCFDYILKQLKPGVTESEIAWRIESFFKTHGADLAFSPIVAFNENSSMPHYSPSTTYKLQPNTLILLDFGARINGYCADLTRIVFLGKPTPEQKRVYEAVLEAQQAVLDYLSHISIYEKGRRKISGAELDKIARDVIENAGLPPYLHSLGHNVGLFIHEAPRLSIKKDPSASSGQVLKPGMVFTIEPAVYLEGKFGIRIEDLVLLKENGLEILSQSPKTLISI